MTNQASNIFKYSNNTYTVVATLYTGQPTDEGGACISLDPIDIEEISYEGKLNDFILRGRVVYTDRYAFVDRMLDYQFGYLDLTFGLNKKKDDGSIDNNELDESSTFRHKFIASSIKVIDRTVSIIKYQIDIVSISWFKCIANLHYSNYSIGPQPLLDIARDCITTAGLAVDPHSFSVVRSPVSLNYASQLDDNLLSIIRYLMHKMYYFPTRDESIKLFTYDQLASTVKLIDLARKDTALGMTGTVLSFFKTNVETLIQQEPTNLGSFRSPAQKTLLYQSILEQSISTYDYQHDLFGVESIPQAETIGYLNNRIDSSDYQPRFQEMFDSPGVQRANHGSYWNNSQETYYDVVQALEENNAIVMNITGDIHRQPGTYTSISIDRDLKNITNDSAVELQKMKKKYKSYEGLWMASKVKNIIQPAVPAFRQQVALFRNFTSRKQLVTSS